MGPISASTGRDTTEADRDTVWVLFVSLFLLCGIMVSRYIGDRRGGVTLLGVFLLRGAFGVALFFFAWVGQVFGGFSITSGCNFGFVIFGFWPRVLNEQLSLLEFFGGTRLAIYFGGTMLGVFS